MLEFLNGTTEQDVGLQIHLYSPQWSLFLKPCVFYSTLAPDSSCIDNSEFERFPNSENGLACRDDGYCFPIAADGKLLDIWKNLISFLGLCSRPHT
jgi:hypothetical protein